MLAGGRAGPEAGGAVGNAGSYTTLRKGESARSET